MGGGLENGWFSFIDWLRLPISFIVILSPGPLMEQLLTQKWDGTYLDTIDGTSAFSDWQVPEEGINLQGGFATFQLTAHHKPERVFLKRMKKLDVLHAVICDRLKQFFPGGAPATGSHFARIMFAGPLVLQRTLRASGKVENVTVVPDDERHWFLILRRIEGQVLRQWVTEQYALPEPPKTLWLPSCTMAGPTQPFMEAFVGSFLYRLILGVKDPGPGNFLVHALPLQVYSLDEGSAFSPELSPLIDKIWLDSNLGKTKRSPQVPERLAAFSFHAQSLIDKWKKNRDVIEAQVKQEIKSFSDHLPNENDRSDLLQYVMHNLFTLEQDWRRYCNIVVPALAPAPVAALADNQFDVGDLHLSYHRAAYGGFMKAEMSSLLQKGIRRNMPQLAHFAASVLLASFQVTNLCNRLMTIATEDIGLGNLNCVRLALELHQLKSELYSTEKVPVVGGATVGRWKRDVRNNEGFRAKLWLCIEEMCRSPKTRICDHMSMTLISPNAANEPFPKEEEVESWLKEMVYHRGDLGKEEHLTKLLAKYLGPANLKQARRNSDTICRLVFKVLYESGAETPMQLVVHGCQKSIAARNSTLPTKLAGKTSLVTLILLCSRPLDQICFQLSPEMRQGITPYNPQIYADLRARKNLPLKEVPQWAKDKHTTYVPGGGNVSFVKSEQAALQPFYSVCVDPYYERALTQAASRDASITDRRLKRTVREDIDEEDEEEEELAWKKEEKLAQKKKNRAVSEKNKAAKERKKAKKTH
jgi:hypothetical protein